VERSTGLKKAKDDGREELRWSIERRLECIDFRLFWEGHINRSDLTDQFGISTPQTSADLAQLSPSTKLSHQMRRSRWENSAWNPVCTAICSLAASSSRAARSPRRGVAPLRRRAWRAAL